MNTAVLERMQVLNHARKDAPRISLTELARSSGWRKALNQKGVVEVVDRTETAAFLVSRQGMAELLETIDSLEEQLERADIASMVNARSGRQNWMSGDELASAAWSEFAARKESFEAVVDGD